MAKFCGKIGYAEVVKTGPGVWEEQITERQYYGDIIRFSRRSEGAQKINEGITISNEISIVADPYANDNLSNMRYVEFMNAKWEITNVEVQFPRLLLSVGGLYNNEEQS